MPQSLNSSCQIFVFAFQRTNFSLLLIKIFLRINFFAKRLEMLQEHHSCPNAKRADMASLYRKRSDHIRKGCNATSAQTTPCQHRETMQKNYSTGNKILSPFSSRQNIWGEEFWTPKKLFAAVFQFRQLSVKCIRIWPLGFATLLIVVQKQLGSSAI